MLVFWFTLLPALPVAPQDPLGPTAGKAAVAVALLGALSVELEVVRKPSVLLRSYCAHACECSMTMHNSEMAAKRVVGAGNGLVTLNVSKFRAVCVGFVFILRLNDLVFLAGTARQAIK